VSALVETVTRLVVQELLEAEQIDFLGDRSRHQRRAQGQCGLAQRVSDTSPGLSPDHRVCGGHGVV